MGYIFAYGEADLQLKLNRVNGEVKINSRRVEASRLTEVAFVSTGIKGEIVIIVD